VWYAVAPGLQLGPLSVIFRLLIALLLLLLLLQPCQVILLAALTLGDALKQLSSALAQVGHLLLHATPPSKRAWVIVSGLGTRVQ
jgi:hypothetical protein